MEDMIFRKANKNDLLEMLQLLFDDELGYKRESLDSSTFALYENIFESIDTDSAQNLMVVELKSEIIATCHYTYIPSLTFKGAMRMHVEAVRVKADYRSKGVGAWMFQQCKDIAIRDNIGIMQLMCDKRREGALKFYKSIGFTDTHQGMKIIL